MKSSATPRTSSRGRELLLPLAAGILYVGLRLAGWLNTPELEGHDSVRYLEWAEVFRSLDLRAIVGMSADAAPLFPLATGLLSFLTSDVEAAARLVSMLSSVATMAAVYVIGRRVGTPFSAASGILLLAIVSPDFYRMSWSAMSDPLYIALFSWAAAVLLATISKPTVRSGISLGILCALAFLTRVEGILLMAALPLLHLIYATTGEHKLPVRSIAIPNLILVLVMIVIIAPQVLRVSSLMNSFALNGRSVWPVMLASPDGRSYDEKLTGLDYDPKILNLHYLQTHPDAVKSLAAQSGRAAMMKSYASTVIKNVRSLHDRQLVALVGLPVLAFSVVGFLALLRSGRGADAVLLAAFVGIALVGPLVYEVTLRHLLVIVPFLCIFAGRGVHETSQVVASRLIGRPGAGAHVLVGLLLVVAVMPLQRVVGYVVRTDDINTEYDAAALAEPVAIVRRFAATEGRRPGILTRKTYLAYLSRSSSRITPYTDLAGLLTYIEDLDLDFFFVEERHVRDYPFVAELDSAEWRRHFRTVWSGGENDGERSVLYAVR